MKKLIKGAFLLAIIATVHTGCQKDETVTSLPIENNSEMLTFSNELEYEQLLSELDFMFNDNSRFSSSNDGINGKINYSDFVKKDLDLLQKYEKLDQHNSLLKLNYEATLIADLGSKTAFIKEHNTFFTLIPVVNEIGLKISKSLAALLNEDGKVKIGEFIYQNTEKGYRKYDLNNTLVEINEKFKGENDKSWGIPIHNYVEIYPANSNHLASVQHFYEQRLASVWEKLEITHWLYFAGTYYIVPGLEMTLNRDFLPEAGTNNSPSCVSGKSYKLSKQAFNVSQLTKVKRICTIGGTGNFSNWDQTEICFNIRINTTHLFHNCKIN